jgi:hypothetical protein
MSDKQVLVTYSALDDAYSNGSVRYARGLRDAAAGTPTVGTIDNPSDTGVPLLPADGDPKMFSFVYKGEARMLLAKVTTTPGALPSTCTWTMLAVPDPAYGDWNTMAKDITLQYDGVNVATNPYGVAQVDEWLYIIDYDSQTIYTLGINEINGLPHGTTYQLTHAPFDLGPTGGEYLPDTAKGQAIIALSYDGTNFLYALYIDVDATGMDHQPGHLVRMTVGGRTITPVYNAQLTVGLNPQEIVPVTRTNGTTALLVPAVGGAQQAGLTNGTESNITSVPAFGSWTDPAPVLITGDSAPATRPAYDIHAIAAPMRGDDAGVVYILTLEYGAGYNGTDWALYQTTVSDLFDLKQETKISDAGFNRVEGVVGDAAGYFWSILYENGDAADNDRLWFFRGTPLLVTPASAYLSPQPAPTPANEYFPAGNTAGEIGGVNVDWADLTAETLSQAAAGVSLKRGFRSVIKAPKAAKAEEEEKK